MLYLFAQDIGQFPIFPGQGSYVPISDGVWQWAEALILPWIVLAAASAAIYARYLRSSLIDVMDEDYIRTARAKGLPRAAGDHAPRRAQRDHADRHPARPRHRRCCSPATRSSPSRSSTSPASGGWSFTAIDRSDLPMIQGVTLFGAFFIIIFNLIVDIAYAYLDPRVRYS